MALTQNTKVLWEDISNIFTSLNTARQKHGFSTVSVSSLQNSKAEATLPTQLKTYIEQMKSDGYVGSNATVSFTMPNVGDLLDESIFVNLQSTITKVQNVCRHNSHDSVDFSTDWGDFSHDGTHKSHDGTDFSTDYSFSANQAFHYNGFTWDGRAAF